MEVKIIVRNKGQWRTIVDGNTRTEVYAGASEAAARRAATVAMESLLTVCDSVSHPEDEEIVYTLTMSV